jgi:hypothetical protein
MKLARVFEELQRLASRDFPIPKGLRDFKFDRLDKAIAQLGKGGPDGPIRCAPDVLAKWHQFVRGAAVQLSPYDVRRLCWDPDVVHSAEFRRMFTHPELSLPRALEGLGFCLQMKWRTGANNEMIREVLLQAFWQVKLSRRLQAWREQRALTIDPAAPTKLCAELLRSEGAIAALLDRYRITGTSELAGQVVEFAIRSLAEQFDRLPSSGKSYLFNTLLKWNLISKEILYNVLPALICAPGVDADKECQQTIISMVLTHPLLGDPRIDTANWLRTEAMRKAADIFSSWLAVEDIRIFFEVLLAEGEDPHGRRVFWLDYVKNVRRSRVFVSEEDYDQRRAALQRLEADGRTFGRLKGATSAFVLHFGEYVAVEFSESGNAAYLYKASDFTTLVPDIFTRAMLKVSSLKDPKRAVERIRHGVVDTWMPKARAALRELGVYKSRYE